MNTDSSDLTLMQLSDSFFPSGLYTMSNGLETIFDEKRVSSENDVHDFLEVFLSGGCSFVTLGLEFREEWSRFGLHVLSLHIDIDIDFDKFDLR